MEEGEGGLFWGKEWGLVKKRGMRSTRVGGY
jgi:hypothetical protein